MKTLLVMAIATVSILLTGASWANDGSMMHGGAWSGGWMGGWMGGYGGMWVPILLAIAVIALVVWIVRRGGK